MTIQNEHSGHGLAHNPNAQMILAVIGIVAVVTLAWFYVF